MKALTVWQPWAGAISHGTKSIENRGWAPWPNMIGQRIAIHAGARKMTRDERETSMRQPRFALPWPHCEVYGAIVATAIVVDFWSPSFDQRTRPKTELFQDWYVPGEYGWYLADRFALPTPIPCKGLQGLWDVPQDVFEAMIDQNVPVERPHGRVR